MLSTIAHGCIAGVCCTCSPTSPINSQQKEHTFNG